MSRAVFRFFALTLPLALLVGSGCDGVKVPTRSPVSTGKTPKKASPSIAPTPKGSATTSLKNPTPSPSVRVTPSPSPRASATPLPEYPSLLGRPVAINPDGTAGFSPDTRNFVVVSAGTPKAPATQYQFVLDVGDGSGVAAASTTNYKTAATAGLDPHMAFRAREQALLAGERPVHPGYRVQQAAPMARGAELPFYVITGFDEANYQDVKVTGRLEKVGKHCYIFVDKDVYKNTANGALMVTRAEQIASRFDDEIYPTNTRLFGAEPNPGVDNDPRVVIFISPAVGNYGKDTTLGFFSQRDEFKPTADSKPIFQHSNAREILFVASSIVLNGTEDDYLGTIAHEFQHMINFNQKVLVHKNERSDDLWIDEGMAMYAIEANGFGLKEGGSVLANHVKKYQADPAAFSLTDWAGNPDGIGYGPVYLFMVYLADRFSESVIREVVTSKEIGMPNLEAVFKTRGVSFNRVFHDWSMANFLDGRSDSDNPHHHYQSLSMNGMNGKTKLLGFTVNSLGATSQTSLKMRPYSMKFFELPKGEMNPRVDFSVTTGAGTLPRLVLP